MPNTNDIDALVQQVKRNAAELAKAATGLREKAQAIDGEVTSAMEQYYPGFLISPEIPGNEDLYLATWRGAGLFQGRRKLGIAVVRKGKDEEAREVYNFVSWFPQAAIETLKPGMQVIPKLLHDINAAFDRHLIETRLALSTSSETAKAAGRDGSRS